MATLVLVLAMYLLFIAVHLVRLPVPVPQGYRIKSTASISPAVTFTNTAESSSHEYATSTPLSGNRAKPEINVDVYVPHTHHTLYDLQQQPRAPQTNRTPPRPATKAVSCLHYIIIVVVDGRLAIG